MGVGAQIFKSGCEALQVCSAVGYTLEQVGRKSCEAIIAKWIGAKLLQASTSGARWTAERANGVADLVGGHLVSWATKKNKKGNSARHSTPPFTGISRGKLACVGWWTSLRSGKDRLCPPSDI